MGFAFAALGGTLLHYLYEWTGGSVLAAPFSGVNESTWEHMKLLYFPLFAFALIQSRFFVGYENFWCIKLCGASAGLLAIPALFYTYNGAIGPSPDWLNIAIFFVSAAITFLLETYLFMQGNVRCKRSWLALAGLCVVGALFVVFTFYPPKLPLFKDPVTGGYGR